MKLNIKAKMMLGAGILALVPLITGSGVLAKLSSSTGAEVLQAEAESKLIGLRDAQKRAIETYMQQLHDQVKSQALTPEVSMAMRDFSRSFFSFRSEAGRADVDRYRQALADYYANSFAKEYQTKTTNAIDWKSLLGKMDADAVALQYELIQNNPNPLGSKHQLDNMNVESAYAAAHKRYHPAFREFLERFGYCDIFLVDADTGHVVYSVFKELDYATSLKKGSWANTGLATAYRAGLEAGKGESAIVDFAPYTPSYEAQAGFIASPVYVGNHKAGVLIFQMPIDRIGKVMTFDKHWQESGLGASGETYLVGADKLLRSDSRFLIEDKAGYLKALTAGGVSKAATTSINNTGSSIGLQPADTPGVQAALAGETGFDIFPDYRDVPVLSAYTPVNIEGLNWILLAEVDEEEAFAGVAEIESSIISGTVVTVIIIAILALLVGWIIAGAFVRPIMQAVAASGMIAKGNFTQAIKTHLADEMGDLLRALDQMRLGLAKAIKEKEEQDQRDREIMQKKLDEQAKEAELVREFESSIGTVVETVSSSASQVNGAASALASMAEELSRQAAGASSGTEQGLQSVEATAAATEEMSSTINEVSQRIQEALSIAGRAESEAQHTNAIMLRLAKVSTEIGNVVNTINEIAEQTNLLALNASIEAARAGDAGRGFAVVANEVKDLAQQTARATGEIEQQITGMQQESGAAVKAIEAISKIIATINEHTQTVASAMEQQSAAVSEISEGAQESSMGMNNVREAVNDVASASEEAAQTSAELLSASDLLGQAADEQKRVVVRFLSELHKIRG